MTETTIDLNELTRLCDGATPGPWLYGPLSDEANAWPLTLEPHGKGAALIAIVFSEDDRDFIAAARTDMPALIARVRELERHKSGWIGIQEGTANVVKQLEAALQAERARSAALLKTLKSFVSPKLTTDREDGLDCVEMKAANGQYCIPDSHAWELVWAQDRGDSRGIITTGQIRRARALAAAEGGGDA